MKLNFLKKLVKKGRKYPIRKDEFGRSARQRAFLCFDSGGSPAQATQKAEISIKTARRYKAQWNKRTRNMEAEFKVLKQVMKNKPELFQRFIDSWSEALGMAREEVVERLQQPHGLKQLLLGKWPNYARERRMKAVEADFDAAVKFVKLMRILGFTPHRVDQIIEEFLKEALKRKAMMKGKDLIGRRVLVPVAALQKMLEGGQANSD